MNPRLQQNDSAFPTKSFHQKQVFHQSDFREPANPVEDVTSDENALITVGQPANPDPESVADLQEPKAQARGVNGLPKAAADTSRLGKDAANRFETAPFDPAVGVQKQQDISPGTCSAGVLLSRAASHPGQTLIRGIGPIQRSIGTSSVDDDDFACAKLACVADHFGDTTRFVQCWNDDRNVHPCLSLHLVRNGFPTSL